MVIHSTNGHLVFIAPLLSMGKNQEFLRAFCTVRYTIDAKRWLYVEKNSVALSYKEADVIVLNGSSVERIQSLAGSLAWLW